MTVIATRLSKQQTIRWKPVVLAVISPIALFAIYSVLPVSLDWLYTYRPAALAVLGGQSPYALPIGFYNAPWAMLVFLPFALLPARLGQFGVFLISFCGFAYIARALKAKPMSAMLFLTSVPVLGCLYGGGLDWLAMLSFVLPAPLALIFAAMKPQIGVGIGLYWLIESWRIGKVKEVVRNFLPVSLLLLGSFVLYGFWFKSFEIVRTTSHNVSIFPYLLPIGFCLIWIQRKRAAMAASVCLSPYYTFAGLAAPLVSLLEYPKLMFAAWIITWLYPLFSLFFMRF